MDEGRGTKSIHRALDVLGALERHPSGLTLTSLSSYLKLPKSTVHRILNALIERQFVRELPDEGRYALGYEILRLSQACLAGLDLVREARPQLEALNQELDENVILGVLDDTRREIIYLDKLDSSKTVRMFSRVGQRAPVHCTALGKAALACFTETELREILAGYEFTRFTEQTIVEPEAFLRELDAVRQRGYAVDCQEYRPQVACVAAPIRNHAGQLLAVVSVSAPIDRLGAHKQAAVGARVMKAAHQIGTLLAHVPLQEVR